MRIPIPLLPIASVVSHLFLPVKVPEIFENDSMYSLIIG